MKDIIGLTLFFAAFFKIPEQKILQIHFTTIHSMKSTK